MSTAQSELVKDASQAHGLSLDAHPKHRRLKNMRQELEQMRSDSIAIANSSDEARTLLHSIRGFIRLMLEDKVPHPETQRESLAIVDEQTRRLTNMVIGILYIAEFGSGQTVFERRTVSMKDMNDKSPSNPVQEGGAKAAAELAWQD